MLFLCLSASYAFSSSVAAATPSFAIAEQTLEYLTNPLGVDIPTPRFSWKVVPVEPSAARGRAQTAYQLTVMHAANQSVLWDSGKVEGNETHHVTYGGAALSSDSRYSWTVTSYLDDGSALHSSATPASFGTAFLDQKDWKATWITGGDAARLLRKEFTVPAVSSHATLFVAGIGYHEIELNGVKVGDAKLEAGWSTFSKRVYYATHDVSHRLVSGSNALGVALGNGWFSCGAAPGTTQPGCDKSPPQLLLQLQIDGRPVVLSDTSWAVHAGPVTYDSLYNGVCDGM